MKKFERARSEEEKQHRRALILKAAAQIIDKSGFPTLTMDAVAKRCKLAKATLYGYFQTREELLLAILQQDFAGWFTAFRGYLDVVPVPFSDSFVEVWISGINSQPRLATGLMYLHIQLEANISIEFAEAWKRFLYSQLKETHYQLLSRFEPAVPLDLFAKFFISVTAVTIGLWTQSQSNEIIKTVYKNHPELRLLDTDFNAHMQVVLKAMLESPEYAKLRTLKRHSDAF